MSNITFQQGDDTWKKLRYQCLVPEPGRRSALWFLAATVLGMEPLIPMTYQAHWSLCLFAERATGIPEIDNARVQLIQVPRGFGKSALVTKCRAIQELLRYDDYSIGIANEKQDLANGFLAQIKLEFEQNELLQALFPERIPDFRNTTWSADRIVIKRGKPRPTSPSVLAAGVGATVTGVHVDEWIVDDPISQNAAENALRGSFTEIEATNRWFPRLEPLLCSPKRDKITVIGTPWWAGDTYEYLEGDESNPGLWGHGEPLRTFLWNVPLPDGTTQTITLHRRGEMAIYRRPAIHNGKSIFPERWTVPELEMIARQDPVFFQANYMLAPAEGGATTFQLDWLHTYEWDGPRKHITFRDQNGFRKVIRVADLTTFISCDPAFSDNAKSARTAIPVVGTDGEHFFILEDFAERGLGPQDISNKIAEFAVRYKPHTIFLETIVAQKALVEPIKRALTASHVHPEPMLDEISSHGKRSKELRIYGLEPWFKGGQFYYHPSQVNFRDEYSTFPRGSKRDLLDALAFQVERGWERTGAGSSKNATGAAAEFNKRTLDKLKKSTGIHGGY